MKNLMLIMTLFTGGLANAENLDPNPFSIGDSTLRQHVPLIIEISNLELYRCLDCSVPKTNVSFDLKALDARLYVTEERTRRGSLWHPVLEDFETSFSYTMPDSEERKIPKPGRYIGSIWQSCAPSGIAADGSCRKWKIHYHLRSEAIPINID
jgi:hypothetical protein